MSAIISIASVTVFHTALQTIRKTLHYDLVVQADNFDS